jgi:hypothetical protein
MTKDVWVKIQATIAGLFLWPVLRHYPDKDGERLGYFATIRKMWRS